VSAVFCFPPQVLTLVSRRQLIKLHVTSLPDEEVTVTLDLDRVQVALQRTTTLEIAAFSESLGKEIDALVPPQLRSKKLRGGDANTVDFTLRTRDLTVGLCRGGRTFLVIVMVRLCVVCVQTAHQANPPPISQGCIAFAHCQRAPAHTCGAVARNADCG
jgi:hypothetical protein